MAPDGHLTTFPPVTLGAVAGATNREELVASLGRSLQGRLALRGAQQQYFALDGGNAGRVANLIRSIVTPGN